MKFEKGLRMRYQCSCGVMVEINLLGVPVELPADFTCKECSTRVLVSMHPAVVYKERPCTCTHPLVKGGGELTPCQSCPWCSGSGFVSIKADDMKGE